MCVLMSQAAAQAVVCLFVVMGGLSTSYSGGCGCGAEAKKLSVRTGISYSF